MILLFNVLISYLDKSATPIADLSKARIFIRYLDKCVWESECMYVRLCWPVIILQAKVLG